MVRTRSVRLPTSTDTRVLVLGVAAFVALVAYLTVAYATTHALAMSGAPGQSSKVAPWTPSASKLAPVRYGKEGEYAVRVIPAAGRGSYGAVVQTLVPSPTPGRTYDIGLSLKAASPGPVGVELNEFRPGVARYPVQRTVSVTTRWHHFIFSVRVRGTWLGLAVYVYRSQGRRTWFAMRGLSAAVRGR